MAGHPTRLRLLASALLAVPLGVLLLFGLGEMAEGDLSGVQHLVEAAPLLVLLVAGWRFPRAAGVALLVLGPGLLAVWVLLIATGTFRPPVAGTAPLAMKALLWLAVPLTLFAPPTLAGWLLVRSSKGA